MPHTYVIVQTPCQNDLWTYRLIRSHLLPFALIYADYGLPVNQHDQIGCDESTRITDRVLDADFCMTELFVEELDNLIKHLKLTSFEVLSH